MGHGILVSLFMVTDIIQAFVQAQEKGCWIWVSCDSHFGAWRFYYLFSTLLDAGHFHSHYFLANGLGFRSLDSTNWPVWCRDGKVIVVPFSEFDDGNDRTLSDWMVSDECLACSIISI